MYFLGIDEMSIPFFIILKKNRLFYFVIFENHFQKDFHLTKIGL